MGQTPTRSKKTCAMAGCTLLGILLSHYGLMWSPYGMGHTSHACNYAGCAIVVLSPFLAAFGIAFVASGRIKVADGWKGPIVYGLWLFLTGPVLYFLVVIALSSIDPALCALPPLGWG